MMEAKAMARRTSLRRPERAVGLDSQDRLGAVASAVGVPRVWFDDIWGDRVPVGDAD
jgi:hypothetical protein